MGIVCMAASSSTWCAERTVGGGSANPPPFVVRKLVQRIREEFEEFPHLQLTVSEAARFWGLEIAASRRVLTELRTAGFLALDLNGRYRLR
jgi:hypothetical protein